MASDHVHDVHDSIEVHTWAPWLRFSLDEMLQYNAAFPEGQIVHVVDDRPAGSLTTVRTRWSGDPTELGTWDAVSGHDTSIAAAHDPEGDTLVMLSVSVHPEAQGQGVPADLVRHARRLADDLGIQHLISPFRPSGFGAHKAAGGEVDFAGYVATQRWDGLPADPWLRVLARMGMRPLRVSEQAMVVPVGLDELDRLRREHRPSAWFRLDERRARTSTASVDSDLVGTVAEVWECGETGAWYVDRDEGRATYVEHNVWGELPIRPDGPAPDRSWSLAAAPLALPSLERELVEELRQRAGEVEVAMAWVPGPDPRAEVVRQLERAAFPDIAAFLDDEVERWSRFLVIIDFADGPPQIGQAFRVGSHRYGPRSSDAIGMPTVDEIVAANDDITLDEVVEHYRGEGIDLRRNISVESSFRVPGRRRGARGLRWSDFGYVELCREAKRDAPDEEERGVFAHCNEATVRSLASIGITVAPFAGRPDLGSPASQPGTHDDRYRPTYLTARRGNGEILGALEEIAPDAFLLGDDDGEVVIDLRDSTLAAAREREVGSDQPRQHTVEQ